MTTYYLHLDYNDLYIAKFKVRTDDINLVYKEISEKIILEGFRNGYTIEEQVHRYKVLCDKIYQQKDRCEKIRASDFLLFFSCYVALCKFNQIKPTEYMFLKKKKRKRLQN